MLPGIDIPASRIALVGPTASGKTAVAFCLAERLGCEIISADSMQVYRRMDIGTAKPTAEDQARAVFHLIDVADPDTPWTLANFQEQAEEAIADVRARRRLPLIAGGTGLYIRALTTRLDIPSVPPAVELREAWRRLAETQGNAALQAELAKVDPAAAARIHGNDVKRLIRALEVHAATGVPLSEWHARNQAQDTQTDTMLFGLHFENRELLYRRIDERVDTMIADGLPAEVQKLLDLGYGRDLRPMQALGYRHLAAVIAGEVDLETAIDAMKGDTRRFAKRQLTWFRADPRIRWMDAEGRSPEELADEIWVQLMNGKQ